MINSLSKRLLPLLLLIAAPVFGQTISTWSTTAADNDAATPNGAPEGMAPSAVNDVIRQNMAAVRAWYENAQWIDLGYVPTRTGNTTFTIPTDVTGVYQIGRRVRMTGSATANATITASVFATGTTTVTVINDSGNIPATLTTVSVSILTTSNAGFPTWVRTGPGGTVAFPNVSNVADADTGVAFSAANRISLVAGGEEMLRADATTGVQFTAITRFSSIISPTSLSANQNNYHPTDLDTATVMRLTSSQAVSLTGLQTEAYLGRVLLVFNVGSFNITLTGESASSTAAYRFIATVIIAPNQGAFLFYDVTSSRWRITQN